MPASLRRATPKLQIACGDARSATAQSCSHSLIRHRPIRRPIGSTSSPEIRRSIELDVDRRELWHLLADPSELATWLGDEVAIDSGARRRGRVLDDDDRRATSSVEQVVARRAHRMAVVASRRAGFGQPGRDRRSRRPGGRRIEIIETVVAARPRRSPRRASQRRSRRDRVGSAQRAHGHRRRARPASLDDDRRHVTAAPEPLDAVFGALSDPTRRQVITPLLADGPETATALAARPADQSTGRGQAPPGARRRRSGGSRTGRARGPLPRAITAPLADVTVGSTRSARSGTTDSTGWRGVVLRSSRQVRAARASLHPVEVEHLDDVEVPCADRVVEPTAVVEHQEAVVDHRAAAAAPRPRRRRTAGSRPRRSAVGGVGATAVQQQRRHHHHAAPPNRHRHPDHRRVEAAAQPTARVHLGREAAHRHGASPGSPRGTRCRRRRRRAPPNTTPSRRHRAGGSRCPDARAAPPATRPVSSRTAPTGGARPTDRR